MDIEWKTEPRTVPTYGTVTNGVPACPNGQTSVDGRAIDTPGDTLAVLISVANQTY